MRSINKSVTFSFDDGVTQDIRLVEIMNRYGMKCTFNINSGIMNDSGSFTINGMKIARATTAVIIRVFIITYSFTYLLGRQSAGVDPGSQ